MEKEDKKGKDIPKQLQQAGEAAAAINDAPDTLHEPGIPPESATETNIRGPSKNRQSAVPTTSLKDSKMTLQELSQVDENKRYHKYESFAGLACRELPPIPTDNVRGVSLTQTLTPTNYCEINQVYDSPLRILDFPSLPSPINSDPARANGSVTARCRESDINKSLHFAMSSNEKKGRGGSQEDESDYIEIEEHVDEPMAQSTKRRASGTKPKAKHRTGTNRKKSKRTEDNFVDSVRDRSVSEHLEQRSRNSLNQQVHYAELLGRTSANYEGLNHRTRERQVEKGMKTFSNSTNYVWIPEATKVSNEVNNRSYAKLDPRSLIHHNLNGRNNHAASAIDRALEGAATSRQPGNEPHSQDEKAMGTAPENRRVLLMDDCSEKEETII